MSYIVLNQTLVFIYPGTTPCNLVPRKSRKPNEALIFAYFIVISFSFQI